MKREALPASIDISAQVGLTVPFHDADPAGFAWHGNYFRYFDEARCALLAKIDYGYQRMMDAGLFWPIVQASVRYVRPLPFDARVTVAARLTEWEYRLRIGYEIRDAENRVATTGETVQVAVCASTREMRIGAPDSLRECLHAYLERENGR